AHGTRDARLAFTPPPATRIKPRHPSRLLTPSLSLPARGPQGEGNVATRAFVTRPLYLRVDSGCVRRIASGTRAHLQSTRNHHRSGPTAAAGRWHKALLLDVDALV